MKQTADFFISTERNGRLVKNLREFSDANPDICHKAVNGQPFMIDPRALVLVPNWNCRERVWERHTTNYQNLPSIFRILKKHF